MNPTQAAMEERIDSLHGHDGFLVEAEPLGRIVRTALATQNSGDRPRS
jgi:homoserine acetyltransferase